jgi:hypothetical protein
VNVAVGVHLPNTCNDRAADSSVVFDLGTHDTTYFMTVPFLDVLRSSRG